MIRGRPSPIIIEEVTDPAELAEAQARRARLDRNSAWFQAHAGELYELYRGRCVVVSSEQVFVGDTAQAAWALADAAPIQDPGSFLIVIPREKLPRIYVSRR